MRLCRPPAVTAAPPAARPRLASARSTATGRGLALPDAALEEFAAKGFAGARVRDIAQRAGSARTSSPTTSAVRTGSTSRCRGPGCAARTASPTPASRSPSSSPATCTTRSPTRVPYACSPGAGSPARARLHPTAPLAPRTSQAPVTGSSGASSPPTSTPPCSA